MVNESNCKERPTCMQTCAVIILYLIKIWSLLGTNKMES